MSNGVVSFSGNLADDPELRFTTNGAAICNMRVAVNESYRDAKGEWKQNLLGYYTVNVWRQLGENCAKRLKKGSGVTVIGKLSNRQYETKDGEKRWVTEVNASDVGMSLMWVHKNEDDS